MKNDPVPCGKYQHYKNKKIYEVIGNARHSETLEEMVIYKALYQCDQFGNNAIWVRPKKMFIEHVIYDGKQIPRFQVIIDSPPNN